MQPTTPNAPNAPGSPMLELLQRLARAAANRGVAAGPLRLEAVEPLPDGATLVLRLGPPGTLLDVAVRLRLTITAVDAERTRCTLSLPEAGGLSRLLGGTLNRLPTQHLQPVLQRLFGASVSLDGDTLVLHHRGLVDRLAKPR